MSIESVVFLIFIGAVSMWMTWMSISDRATRRKRLAARGRKHLRIVKKHDE